MLRFVGLRGPKNSSCYTTSEIDVVVRQTCWTTTFLYHNVCVIRLYFAIEFYLQLAFIRLIAEYRQQRNMWPLQRHF